MPTEEDAEDIFDTSLSALFNVPPIALSPDHSGFCKWITPDHKHTLTLRIPSPPADLHAKLQANHLWLSGIYLAEILYHEEIDLQGKNVLELGAGAGLPGIIAGWKGARVVGSDWDDGDVIGALKSNYAENCKDMTWKVVGHTWGTDTTPVTNALDSLLPGRAQGGNYPKFDVILLADTLWVSDAHSVLLTSIAQFLNTTGIVYIAAGLHTGHGPIDRFCELAQSRGFVVDLIRRVRWKVDGGWEEQLSKKEGLEEERGVVVFMEMRWNRQQ